MVSEEDELMEGAREEGRDGMDGVGGNIDACMQSAGMPMERQSKVTIAPTGPQEKQNKDMHTMSMRAI